MTRAVTRLIYLLLFAGVLSPFPAMGQGYEDATEGPVRVERAHAALRALDKVTGHVRTLVVPVGTAVPFGTLSVIVRTCRTTPPEETPESAAFLDIWEQRPDQPAQEVFRGWMFASSPAVSAMEHPVYDIWVEGCPSTDSTL